MTPLYKNICSCDNDVIFDDKEFNSYTFGFV